MQSTRQALKFLIGDTVGDFLYFPFWWYSRGLLRAGRFLVGRVRYAEKRLGLSVWLLNLFTPMYGVRDIAGQIISFFMRLFQIIVRFLAMLFLLVWYLALFVVYLILPIFVIFQILRHIAAFFEI